MKRTPIFKKILVPLMGLVIIEILILVCTMFGQGLLQELNANERKVIQGKVEARKNYLESVLINDWMNLGSTVDDLTDKAQRMYLDHEFSLESIDSSSRDSGPYLAKATPQLIEMMRSNHVTGAYVILNTHDLSGSLESGEYRDKSGVYLRDQDPSSLASERNEDILIECSPLEVVEAMRIATDTDWDLKFRFSRGKMKLYEALYYPFQTAYEHPGEYEWQDMGYWSAQYDEDAKEVLFSYSVPLVITNDRVIGVLGIELTQEYLQTLLPYEELDETGQGTYVLAQYDQEQEQFSHVFGSGSMEGLLTEDERNYIVDHENFYSYMEPLRIYNSNTPFSDQQWVLAGMIPYSSMHGFSKDLIVAVAMAVIAALVIGIGVSFAVSYKLQRPVAQLAHEMHVKDPRRNVNLNPTGILEIDQMADEVMRLSHDILESGRKFSKIIEMASVRLAGFQIDRDKHSLFLTENFFAIFGRTDIQGQGMSVEEFKTVMEQFRPYYVEPEEQTEGCIFRIPMENEYRFIQVRLLDDGHSCYGLAEDVTQALQEKQTLKYERDHDSLTNLYNRRAFRRKMQRMFDTAEERIGIGALVMIDLDNLKYINDTYGHEYGDRYIKAAASVLAGLKGSVYYARISGDEFNVFLYGDRSREEIEAQIQELQIAINSAQIALPDGRMHCLHATGGVAWYPKDSRSFDVLSKYADYAMYTVKLSKKGAFQNFDIEQFRSQDSLFRSRSALTRMIENRMVHYAFQPIVDARTGDIFAYEALMRPDVAELLSVREVMEVARREGKLNQIEELTWFAALETFDEYIREERIAKESFLFVNSIPNQRLSSDKERILAEKYGKYGRQIVMELTEDEQADREIWDEKQRRQRAFGGYIALDDYGTGYNSEKTLLMISPDFIKVDMAIVHDIHLSDDKRTIMEHIVSYAHERGKYIIAEGVETREEVEAILALNVDYMQGYFFAKPQQVPDGVSEESRKLLKQIGGRKK